MHELHPDVHEAVCDKAAEALGLVLAELSEEHQGKGAFFRVAFLEDPVRALFFSLEQLDEGWVDGAKNRASKAKCWNVSFEKMQRLAQHAPKGHRTSYESADPEEHRYQGAVLLQATVPGFHVRNEPVWLIVSCSGLPAEADEAFCLLLLLKLEWNVRSDAVQDIISRTNNNLAAKLFGRHVFDQRAHEPV